jgi:hypothetical protein
VTIVGASRNDRLARDDLVRNSRERLAAASLTWAALTA